MHKKKLRHDHKPIRNHCSFKCALSILGPEFQKFDYVGRASFLFIVVYDKCTQLENTYS